VQVSTILDQIDLGSMALPEFQRGYVWNRDQVRSFMYSLYRKHPVGSLLVWVAKTETSSTRGDGGLTPGSVKLLLDGQQRITSLYGIIRGKAPKFFDGNTKTFTGLHFNLEEENFEFYAPLKMKDNPLWIDVTELMNKGVGEFIKAMMSNPDLQPKLNTYINRINAIDQIQGIDLHIEEVTGEEKTVDVVVDIFNRVNTGGTKLSKGDLALAKVCAEWPEARREMKTRLEKWAKAGFNFRLEWLLRCINTVVTGEALFAALKDVDTAKFQQGLMQAEKAVDSLLNLISSRLGLDHDRVLGSRYSFPLLVRYLTQRGGTVTDPKECDKLLYWYVHTFLWGRYAGSTESVLNQDLALIEQADGALDRLVNHLRQNRGDLRLQASDFLGWSKGARFYPLLYMLTRACHARDWETGAELSNHMLGRLAGLELHHIFPRSLLYQHGYNKAEVNALGNFTFLTQETNLKVTNRNPEEYLHTYAQKNPAALESHWIPMDRSLWRVENYPQFLDARRDLLAKTANEFLDSLFAGGLPEVEPAPTIFERERVQVPGAIVTEEERQLLERCDNWLVKQGLPSGEFEYELTDEETGEPLAILDLAWPNGLQEGLSDPVAVLLDEPRETIEIVNRAGFWYFTSIDDFKDYVLKKILAMEVETVDTH